MPLTNRYPDATNVLIYRIATTMLSIECGGAALTASTCIRQSGTVADRHEIGSAPRNIVSMIARFTLGGPSPQYRDGFSIAAPAQANLNSGFWHDGRFTWKGPARRRSSRGAGDEFWIFPITRAVWQGARGSGAEAPFCRPPFADWTELAPTTACDVQAFGRYRVFRHAHGMRAPPCPKT